MWLARILSVLSCRMSTRTRSFSSCRNSFICPTPATEDNETDNEAPHLSIALASAHPSGPGRPPNHCSLIAVSASKNWAQPQESPIRLELSDSWQAAAIGGCKGAELSCTAFLPLVALPVIPVQFALVIEKDLFSLLAGLRRTPVVLFKSTVKCEYTCCTDET